MTTDSQSGQAPVGGNDGMVLAAVVLLWLQLFYSSTQRLCLSSKPSIIHPLWLHVS